MSIYSFPSKLPISIFLLSSPLNYISSSFSLNSLSMPIYSFPSKIPIPPFLFSFVKLLTNVYLFLSLKKKTPISSLFSSKLPVPPFLFLLLENHLA
jgi:hypothetical protein